MHRLIWLQGGGSAHARAPLRETMKCSQVGPVVEVAAAGRLVAGVRATNAEGDARSPRLQIAERREMEATIGISAKFYAI